MLISGLYACVPDVWSCKVTQKVEAVLPVWGLFDMTMAPG